MATVAETREIFNQKGLTLKIDVQDDFEIMSIDPVERYTYPGGGIHYLFKITYIDEKGNEGYDLYPCDGKIIRKEPLFKLTEETPKLSRLEPLPIRDRLDFDSEEEIIAYLGEAITHLLLDKDYEKMEKDGCDLYFQKKERGYFINLASRCNKDGIVKANEVIKLRGEYGSGHDYGLVVPALQDFLGITLLAQENWYREHGEYLSAHRVTVLAVNNFDPNLIFPFTIYPREREMAKYLVHTGSQWTILRNKYLASKKKISVS